MEPPLKRFRATGTEPTQTNLDSQGLLGAIRDLLGTVRPYGGAQASLCMVGLTGLLRLLCVDSLGTLEPGLAPQFAKASAKPTKLHRLDYPRTGCLLSA